MSRGPSPFHPPVPSTFPVAPLGDFSSVSSPAAVSFAVTLFESLAIAETILLFWPEPTLVTVVGVSISAVTTQLRASAFAVILLALFETGRFERGNLSERQLLLTVLSDLQALTLEFNRRQGERRLFFTSVREGKHRFPVFTTPCISAKLWGLERFCSTRAACLASRTFGLGFGYSSAGGFNHGNRHRSYRREPSWFL